MDQDGAPVRCQVTVLARYQQDSSIKSLLIDFQASLKPFETKAYTLTCGQSDQGDKSAPLIQQEGEVWKIDTGNLQARILKNRFRWFESLVVNGKSLNPAAALSGAVVTDPAGQRFGSAFRPPETAEIERNGPLHAVLHLCGRHPAGTEDPRIGQRSRRQALLFSTLD